MNLIEKNIKDIASNIIESNGFFLIDMILRGIENNRVLEVFIDGEKNISAEDCANVSRALSSAIDEENIFDSNYSLIVSSPGTDRPLIYLKQYIKHINRKFEITYSQDNEIRHLTGKLLNISGNELTFLLNNNKETIINFNNIKKAIVLTGFFPKG